MADSASLTTARSGSIAARPANTMTIAVTVSTIGALAGLLACGAPPASSAAIALTVPAAAIDVRQRRIPNAAVSASAVVLVAGGVTGLLLGNSTHAPGSAAGAAAMCAPLLLIHLWSPTAMGFGDVKLALGLGAALGAVAVPLPLVSLALAAGGTSLVGIVRRSRTMPFGPGLVGGAILAAASHPLWIEGVSAAVSGSA